MLLNEAPKSFQTAPAPPSPGNLFIHSFIWSFSHSTNICWDAGPDPLWDSKEMGLNEQRVISKTQWEGHKNPSTASTWPYDLQKCTSPFSLLERGPLICYLGLLQGMTQGMSLVWPTAWDGGDSKCQSSTRPWNTHSLVSRRGVEVTSASQRFSHSSV